MYLHTHYALYIYIQTHMRRKMEIKTIKIVFVDDYNNIWAYWHNDIEFNTNRHNELIG